MKISKESLISYRTYHPEDKNFILSTWLHGLYSDNSFFKKINKNAYYDNYEPILHRIMEDPSTDYKIACLKEDASVNLGYAIFMGEDVLHWVFVKDIWRKIGIMKDLLKDRPLKAVTHLTDLGYQLKPHNIMFNPFLI